MALAPHRDDPSRKEIKKSVENLKKEGTTQAADELRSKHNIDVSGKDKAFKPKR